MRVPFVHVDADLDGVDVGDAVPLRQDQVHHLRRVLRRGDGDPVRISDGLGRVAAGVLQPDGVRVELPVELVPAPTPPITVLHAVPKGRGLDDVVRTLCELGVQAVVPVLTARTEVRPKGEKARIVGDRLRSVALSAAEQAQSAHVSRVSDPTALMVTEREVPDGVVGLVAHPAAERPLGEVIGAQGPIGAVNLLIGPEGGITGEELDALTVGGWVPVRVGETVLRSVHAGPVIVAAVLALVGRYGRADGPLGG